MRFFLYGMRLPFHLRGGVSFSPRDFRQPPPRPTSQQLLPPSIYVIATNDGLCKIGVSRNPEARLASLQTGCPYHLHIVYVCVVKDQAYEVEGLAHTLLRGRKIGGEWFECSEGEAIEAVNKSAASLGKKIKDLAPQKRFSTLDFLTICMLLLFILSIIMGSQHQPQLP